MNQKEMSPYQRENDVIAAYFEGKLTLEECNDELVRIKQDTWVD